jgi:hypothetical protein
MAEKPPIWSIGHSNHEHTRFLPLLSAAGVLDSGWEGESRRFDPPLTGKIAVKVINHYGDEVMRVHEVTP